ncbi:Start control protein cdc10 [Psilocybe cubensis]|uniref:Start control protein cdc10 n=2 Tax=Psilocybe cubensis TaxID=181762 RepID=A0ACB8GVY1_PSICU|nr:Start control protein cdc10 [Psilocybe cubensis]KAH9479381.1 Start control protein cdc10 [Psilocybe cubensis]
MQAGPRTPGSTQPPVKIYNAVYSSVQVYECMVRGIAVMRRRNDSYVNATQILKVAGVDKGRRTKILEKEILPGKHEIVQGGYGKYQGTWIPLERGRDIALQYGVAPLLSPLFDFTPTTNSLGALPVSAPTGTASPRPLSASSSYSSIGAAGNYMAALPSSLAPPPIMPGSALRLLNQGRAQGLFTPSTSGQSGLVQTRSSGFISPGPYQSGAFSSSQTPPPTAGLKRTHSEADAEFLNIPATGLLVLILRLQRYTYIGVTPKDYTHLSRPGSVNSQANGDENASPAKRPRTNSVPQETSSSQSTNWISRPQTNHPTTSQQNPNGTPRPSSSMSTTNGTAIKATNASETDVQRTRFASKPAMPRPGEPVSHYKDSRRTAVIASICQRDDSSVVIDLLREISSDPSNPDPSGNVDVDIVLDDQGHTALHLAASLARQQTVEALKENGADIHRGNFLGETPLIRACLATNNSDQQSFPILVASLYPSIHTLDTSRKSVLHHIVSLAGVKGRASAARYYLEQIFMWIVQQQGGDFRSIVDLQDEHGDTALNIAARVGNRSLVRILLDVGANRILPNKLGLRPGDFGVETEELSGGPRAEDLLASLRSGPPPTVQKSQDVIADMTTMIQNLSAEFQGEIKTKQDALDVTQAHLRAATRELSEQRKQIQLWQSRCAELDQVNQRVRNVERAIGDEDSFDWTGRTDLDGNDGRESAGPAFQYRGAGSTMVGIGGSVDISFSVDSEPPLPTADSVATLIKLRRLKAWHTRMEELVKARLKGLQGATAEKEYQCKKIVALCTGLPIDKVEDMLDNLVIALESEISVIDLGRVSGFMQKVRDGTI